MHKRSQGGSGIAILAVVVIAIVAIAYMYNTGYLNFHSQPALYNSTVPIALSVSSTSNLLNLYPQQNMKIISSVYDYSPDPINVSLTSFGCAFLPLAKKYVEVYPGSSSSLVWNFSSSSSTSCSITFMACFNSVSFTNYPITLKNPSFSGTPPSGFESSSSFTPLSLSVDGLADIVTAPPTPTNSTYYISASQSGALGSTSGLKWLDIAVGGLTVYYTSASGAVIPVHGSVNLSSSSYQLNFSSGKLISPFPIQLETQPVTAASGYTTGADINISAGYNYCIESSPMPVSVS